MSTRKNFLASASCATLSPAMLKRYPNRIATMVQVKDFKPTAIPAAPASLRPVAVSGDGAAQYAYISSAARKASVKNYFVELRKL